ncbi:unnamed protein product [Gulo gulo]|uniref:Uncharacterized protein n=1 Tax=Gulo gulo TaxID=48420 RepID=A0A9X9PWZ7_GULGU|nr:unnamed protein product [Gulo gulo]
MWPSACSTRR